MRVLFTTQPGSGHWRPLAPLAQSLIAAGHDVAFATTPDYCAYIDAAGFTCFGVGQAGVYSTATEGGPPESAESIWTRLFAGSRVEASLPDLLAIGREWQPSVIIREISEFGGCLAAERLAIPHVAVQVSAFRPHLHRAIAPSLNRLRCSLGLPTDPQLEMLYRYLFLTPLSPAFRDPRTPFPATTHAFRYVSFDHDADDRLPGWIDDMDLTPVVYATLGTAYNTTPGIMPAILDALRDEPVTLILTTGDTQDPAAFGLQPPNVHIERYIPQSLLVSYCDLVVCHGGFGTVLTALDHGLPMVIIPIAADQHENARRMVELGVARVVAPEQRSSEAIQWAVREVLNDARYQAQARQRRSAIHALPELDQVVGRIIQLAIDRSPMASPDTSVALP